MTRRTPNIADCTTTLTANAVMLGETLRLGTQIADRAVVADLEDLPLEPDGYRDTRPLLSPHEHCPEFIDMNTQALAYADLRRLIQRDPHYHYRIRILRKDL